MGYWEPHSSSIDFCESNYLLFHHIAEFHNTWSSLAGLSLFGLLGLLYPHNNPTNEWRHTLSFTSLIIIGLGSTALHATLHWVYQSSDELPMIYFTHCLLYMMLEIDAPKGKPNYPWLPSFFLALSFVLTVIYYLFQQLYLVFIFTFTLETLIIAVGFYLLLYRASNPSIKARQWAQWGVGSYLLAGFPLWMVDMLLCPRVLSFVNERPWMGGITPHVLWHFGAGYGAFCFIQALVCLRLEKLQVKID